MNEAKRFWAKVEKTETCWLWMAGRRSGGYGEFWAGGRMRPAHRYAYELLVGPIPLGLTLDHLCRVRHCVNTDHLEPVSQRLNVLRGIGTSALNAKKSHCLKGHPFDDGNTYLSKGRRQRQCRACHQERDRKRYYRMKVAVAT